MILRRKSIFLNMFSELGIMPYFMEILTGKCPMVHGRRKEDIFKGRKLVTLLKSPKNMMSGVRTL